MLLSRYRKRRLRLIVQSKRFLTRIGEVGEASCQFCPRWGMCDTTPERSLTYSVRLTACGTVRRSISNTDRCFSSQRPLRCGAHPASYYSRYRGQSGPDVKPAIHFHLLERLKMRGAVIPHRLRCHDVWFMRLCLVVLIWRQHCSQDNWKLM
jgi:hypothetical protein